MTQDRFITVPSVKFELYLPVSFEDKETGNVISVQGDEIADIVESFVGEYGPEGGYSISNPYAPPPIAGAMVGQPQERSWWVMFIFPDYLLNQVRQDIEDLISKFQDRFQQEEILTHYYSVTRILPGDTSQS